MRDLKLSERKKLQVVGIMSGTSVDGVDYVLTTVRRGPKGVGIVFRQMASLKFPKTLRARLLEAANHRLRVDQLSELHFDLGRFYAKGLRQIQKRKKWRFQLIGLHGQTVHHRGGRATLQIGEPSFLSEAFGVPVVSDFRTADIAVGGEGAPLAPLFHATAFAGPVRDFAFHNLGGISNLTLFRDRKIRLAFDTGPANMPIDWTVHFLSRGRRHFDSSGRGARQGRVHEEMVRAGLKHPYFRKKAPKSCGREEFGERWLRPLLKKYARLSEADLLASVTEIVARSIAQAYRKYAAPLPREIVFSGGGAKNPYLLERIQALLPETQVRTSEDLAWPSQAIEGAAFALLATMRIWGLPADFRASTGAQRPARMGKVTHV